MNRVRKTPAASAPPASSRGSREPLGRGVVAEAYSVEEAARAAGVSRSFLYERIALGELATVKAGKRRLVRVEALRRWLDSLETRAA